MDAILIDQLRQMEADREKLLQRVRNTQGFAYEDAKAALRAHDIAVGKMLSEMEEKNDESC
jgi:phage I-like protein